MADARAHAQPDAQQTCGVFHHRQPEAHAAIVPKHSKKFVRLDDCRFVATKYADGDSFRVAVGEDEFVFRIYFVDCCESDTRFPS